RKPDDDANRPCRIGLRLRDARKSRQRGSASGEMQKFATGKFHGVPSQKYSGMNIRAQHGSRNARQPMASAPPLNENERDSHVPPTALLLGYIISAEGATSAIGTKLKSTDVRSDVGFRG